MNGPRILTIFGISCAYFFSMMGSMLSSYNKVIENVACKCGERSAGDMLEVGIIVHILSVK